MNTNLKLTARLSIISTAFLVVGVLAMQGLANAMPQLGAYYLWPGLLLLTGVACFVTVWLVVQRQVIGPLQTLSKAVTRVRLGDLSQEVVASSRGEIGELEHNFNDMARQLVITQRTTIDARRLAEERLAELQSSINSLRQGFMITDATGEVLQANDAVRELLHLAHQQVAAGADPPSIEQLASILPTKIHLPDAVASCMRARELTKFTSVPYGEGRFIDMFIYPVIQASQAIGSVLLLTDVTEERIMQRSRDEFFSIASHELRTPLTAIRGNMSMAREFFAEAMKDDSLRELVEDTQAASVRLIAIVNDFLESSRLEQGKMIFTFGPVRLAPMVAAIIEDLKPLREQQSNTMESKELDRLPDIWADEGRLRQILYNLLSNANKYSSQAQIVVTGVQEGANIRIRVSDTGKGMSLENQQLLFHKFQQAASSILTRDNTKGTGLGLYISKLLATNMNGDVMLEHSEEGKGSIFAVVLPMATTELIQKAAADNQKVAAKAASAVAGQ